MEQSLLDRYHVVLLAHGVRGYDRRALQDDYRLAVLWQVVNLCPGLSIECTAQPMALSSSVEIQPPWIVPSGFKNFSAGRASNSTRPWSAKMIQMSLVSANGGAG
jgi:hypothetical protein